MLCFGTKERNVILEIFLDNFLKPRKGFKWNAVGFLSEKVIDTEVTLLFFEQSFN